MRSAAASRPRPSPEGARGALAVARRRLEAAGAGTPRLDAEVLLAHVLGCSRAELLAGADRELPAAALERFEALLRRREAREPIAYITGRRGFRRLELAVDPRVLVPRPETELLVEVAAAAARPGARVCDVGTGSGAVALALADERPDLEVVATDRSAGALAVARANATGLGLPVSFARGDLLAAVGGPFDVVAANLPYVAERDLETLQREISAHEPRVALTGGPDGLALVRRLVAQASAREVRVLALEVGAGQAGEVVRMLRAAGRPRVRSHPDLAGIERVVTGAR
ncbi:MAG: peptide chain release factor N(5)-glutamine methyltransferase [Solirubrobacteraceae bacterium]